MERDCSTATSGPSRRSLDDALVVEVDFGKFHGHTLGEIAAFEPSYIDWLAGTQTRDPDARAGRAGDRAGARPARDPAGAPPAAPGWQSNPFR